MLAELQREFATCLLGEPGSVPALIAGDDGLAPARRLAVHRHHLFASLTDALATTYPVVRTLVDPRFFAYAAHAYIAAEPPADPVLAVYGASFADFLAAFPPCREMPWLADVARFEWAQIAALGHPMRPAIAADGLARARGLVLQPSVRLLASPWPVDLVWQANQGPAPGETAVDLDDGPVTLLLWRGGRQALYRRLESGEHALIAALLDGAGLTAATEAALAVDPFFDLLLCLRRLLGDGLIVAATPDPETDR